MSKVEDQIWQMAEPIAQANGLELIEVEFVKEGTEWYLRLFLDKDNDEGVDLDDCELVSRQLSELLETKDPISNAYHLEVSSPGIERPLKRTKDFMRFIGEKIKVRLFTPLDGQKEFIGVLSEASEDTVVLELPEGQITIAREKMSKAHLVWEF